MLLHQSNYEWMRQVIRLFFNASEINVTLMRLKHTAPSLFQNQLVEPVRGIRRVHRIFYINMAKLVLYM